MLGEDRIMDSPICFFSNNNNCGFFFKAMVLYESLKRFFSQISKFENSKKAGRRQGRIIDFLKRFFFK